MERAGDQIGVVARRPPWGLGEVLLGLAVAEVAGSVLLLVWDRLSHQTAVAAASLSAGQLTADLLGVWIGLAGAVVLSAHRARHSLDEEFGWRIRLWPDVPLGVGVGVAAQLWLVPALYEPFVHVVPHLARRLGAPARQLTGGAHGNAAFLVAFLIVVGAPVVEELFFRGLLLRALERRFGSFGWSRGLVRLSAIVVSGLVFALFHFEPLQFLGLAVFGIALGVLASWSRRLGPSTVAHASFNAVAVATLVHFH